jgi:hypothetical protein
MKIELKNIKFSESLSEETNAFTADVYVNGKKLLYAKNSGQGGSTDYNTYNSADRPFLKEVEDYCLGLPPIKSDFGGTLKMDLEFKIDLLLSDWLKAKDEAKQAKKLQKDCRKGLVYKTDNGHGLVSWKGHTIDSILAHPQGAMTIKMAVRKLWREGKTIINTNIPKELL